MATTSTVKPRTRVYVDAFNLYYGSLKGTNYKWLDLEKLCGFLLPNNDITAIHYFTAKVSARPNDPQQPVRQQTYLRALATLPKVQTTFGHYLSHTVSMPLAAPIIDNAGRTHRYAKVIKTEEKGSDVNLAVQLLHDAHQNLFDVAVIISNDSDLVGPIKIIKATMGKTVGVLNPQKNASNTIKREVDFYKPIRTGVLTNSQFPSSLIDSVGTFTKPAGW
ncbi:NYN domain-containing protein [Undibacterium sp. TS12]|uniref:NYN domain-containing protein n=1 Tax=Undibacterium sp. TS12 TaxID=2908202 RepID=UPI001F4C60D2|nr:NYN domain-containing protein [Undibacterium sp. TS12]MCH8622923.1 NYN domain-containing protein [Undibacterium sp. TS12]